MINELIVYIGVVVFCVGLQDAHLVTLCDMMITTVIYDEHWKRMWFMVTLYDGFVPTQIPKEISETSICPW